MADPITVIGLVASISQLAQYTLKICQYAHQINKGPKEKAVIANEASMLFTLLHLLENKAGARAAQNSSSVSGSAERDQLLSKIVNELTQQLKRLIDKIENPGNKLVAKVKWPLDERECQKMLIQIERLKSTIQLTLQEDLRESIEEGRNDIKANLEPLLEEREDKYWIRSRVHLPNARSMRKQQIVLDSSQRGTGSWLLQNPVFTHWVENPGETLWCHGIPGAGKTVMASIIIDYLKQSFRYDEQVGVTCIYCNYDDPRSLFEILSDMYMQLLTRHKTVPDQLKDWIENIDRRDKNPSVTDLKALVQAEVNGFTKVYIVVDALDECVSPATAHGSPEKRSNLRRQVFEALHSFGSRANILITSRVSGELPRIFAKSPRLEISAHHEDMAAYIEQRIQDCGEEYCWTRMCVSDPKFKSRIVSTLIEKASGMFLLVRLHIDALNKQRRVTQVERSLNSLPSDLNDTYKQALVRIDAQSEIQRIQAKRVLTWICFSFRPVQASELQHAEAIAVGERELDQRDLEKIQNLINSCAGLIVIDPSDNIVRFVHYSTQEYFKTYRNVHFPMGHNDMAKVCLTYLLLDDINGKDDDWNFNEFVPSYPLVEYSACYWGYHAKEDELAEQHDEDLRCLALEFLKTPRRYQNRIFESPTRQLPDSIPLPRVWPWQVRSSPSGVHTAAAFGLISNLECLISNDPAELEQTDAVGRTALHYAAANGEEKTVRFLVERGANINAKTSNERLTVLMHATATGRLDVTKYLLQMDADVNPVGSGHFEETTALYEACFFDYPEVVQVLLENGAKHTIRDDGEATSIRWPLAIAAALGRLPIVEKLVEHGVQLGGRNGYIALKESIDNRQFNTTRFLLASGADPRFSPEGEQPLLMRACVTGSLPIIGAVMLGNGKLEDMDDAMRQKAVKLLKSAPWFAKVDTSPSEKSPYDPSLSMMRFSRNHEWHYVERSYPNSYLGIVVPDEVESVSKLVFRAESHDQGYCDDPKGGNWTWFDAAVHSGSSKNPQPVVRRLFENNLARSDWTAHERTWSADDPDEGISKCLRAIGPGFVILVAAWARFPGWVNYVKSFEVEIHYVKARESPGVVVVQDAVQ